MNVPSVVLFGVVVSNCANKMYLPESKSFMAKARSATSTVDFCTCEPAIGSIVTSRRLFAVGAGSFEGV